MHRLSGFMRTYWTRGEPGRATPQSLVVFMHRMWIAALAFKLLGSSWDVSWHFKWLRDDLAAAHVLNTVGTGIAIGLVLAHSFTGYGTDRRSLRIMQIGTAIFVLAGPIDVINHRVNGLDLTAWSPSHMLLYGGTAVMIAGVIRSWYHCYPTGEKFGRQWRIGMVALWAFMFENTFFPTGQQEYGILEIASWFRGSPYAEPRNCSASPPVNSDGRWTTSPWSRLRCRSDRGSTRCGRSVSARRYWSSPGSWSGGGGPRPWWSAGMCSTGA